MSFAVLSADHSHAGHSRLSDFLHNTLGNAGAFIDEVIVHSLIDTLKLILFLFLTYLLMEFIEHRASDKAGRLMKKAGPFGPLLGGAFGVVPQCGFSAAAANLYTGRVIGLGTLIAVFLSTSDEMIPVLIAGEIELALLLKIIGYKTAAGILVGFGVDIALRLMKRGRREINIDELCDNDNCHCERGILYSALHHTSTTGSFILGTTLAINMLFFFLGEEHLADLIIDIPVLSHLIASVIGLIPNCAVSVVLSQLASAGVISFGTMLSGLLTGAGVGLLILFKLNKNKRENLAVVGILVGAGTLFGALFELIS